MAMWIGEQAEMLELRRILLATVMVAVPSVVYAQGATTAPPGTIPPAAGQAAPAAGGGEAAPVPEVEVIQQSKPPAEQPVVQQAPPKPKPPKPAAQKPKPAPAPAAAPPPPPEPDFADAPAEAAPVSSNPIYGASASGGAAARAQDGALSPVNSTSIIPGNLEGFSGAASRLTTKQFDEQRPLTNHEALSKIPGVDSVDDDGMARHSNVSVRGSPARRSRKVLMMEDGMSINFSAYLDPSTHYTPPVERLESIEVLRGATVLHGPLTNHGIINFRNLSPFGDPETVLKFALGNTEGSDHDVNVMRHVHTRQNMGNVGVVASYSGAEAGGAWDNEVLTYNDFYGALGFRGTNQDLTISGGYFRQRDHYDENNFEEGTDADFFANGRNKAGIDDDFLPFLSSYNADYWRIQATHNLYIDQNTTLTTKAYYSDHERNRYFHRESNAAGDFFMRGRERDYDFYGVDSRIEFANLPLFGGMKMDVQVGAKAERHEFTNCNVVGEANEILDADNKGRCDIFEELPAFNDDRSRRGDIEADAYAVFMQTAIHVTEKLTVTPGLRFESYDIERNIIRADDEAGDQEGRTTSEHDNLLPTLGVAWEALPMTTVFASWHRGITPAVTRGTAFPMPDEKGDNYQIGVRSTALKGLAFEVAYFHSDIEDYQVKEAVTSAGGLNIFGRVDEVEINGVELAARLESKPFTGGPWNFFGEGVYTYADSVIEEGESDGIDLSGNKVPEVPEAFANLTLGFAHAMGFDASVTWTYRGMFFTDDLNSPQGEPGEEALFGPVDDVWLLSARANFKVPNTNATLFVSGQNLEDEFYIADRSDGAKPGQGRTIMGGFTYKFD